jgi:RES domain-containing protein
VIGWRFSAYEGLDGRGGLYTSGRWHRRGHEILYCAPNAATSLLEVMVHGLVRIEEALGGYQFLKVQLPDSVSIEDVGVDRLPADWKVQLEVTRDIGESWLKEGRAAVLRVPSVLVPETLNLIVNPRHAEAKALSLVSAYRFQPDARLFNRPGKA